MTSARDQDRASLHATLEEMRREGLIDGGDENAVARHYDERADELKEALARIAPEYERRTRDDGRASADLWLAGTAEAMGRRHAEETRRLLSSVTAQ